MYQALDHPSGLTAEHPQASTTAPAARVPIEAPSPFVISMKRPCALERMSVPVFSLTYSEPEMLKKSKATP